MLYSLILVLTVSGSTPVEFVLYDNMSEEECNEKPVEVVLPEVVSYSLVCTIQPGRV